MNPARSSTSPGRNDQASPTTKKTRLPRFKRVARPPAMMVTDRDKEVLGLLLKFRIMTREQIEKLAFAPSAGQDHFTKTSIARKRLKLLYQHGYVERIAVPVGAGKWAWRPVYRLTKKGAELIVLEGEPVSYWGSGFDKDHRKGQVGLLFLEHALRINDIRIAVIQGAQSNRYKIDKWLDDSTLKGESMRDYVSVAVSKGNTRKVAVIPDAYFVLHLGDRRAHFFLELDLATMTSKRWKIRVRAYQAYIESGKYSERYQTKSLRILTVTTTAKRLANLKKATEQVGENRLFWFATYDKVTTQEILSAPIWFVGGEENARVLIS